MSFVPRKEFLREQPTPLSSFAILAFSSSNCLRLFSFDSTTLAAVRRLLEHSVPILASREDAAQNLHEFSLDGKPWANSKAISTEKLILDIISILYSAGYTYLSTVEYGREADDKLAMAFSKPAGFSTPSGSRSIPPLSPSTSQHQNSSNPSFNDTAKPKRAPFAVSFLSATTMRVVSPPLQLTPAILQAVRNAWPRGVLAEKKIADNTFEFKLKGYKWFEQDTFANDSLVHILSLLAALDSLSFSLIISISFTRSRVKDLWVFMGPASQEISRSGTPDSQVELSSGSAHAPGPTPGTDLHHRRVATEPSLGMQSPLVPLHYRAASADKLQRNHSIGADHHPHVLRKPAPRAQVPISVVQELDIPDEAPQYRTYLPSVISTTAENMTGVGSASHPVFHSNPQPQSLPSPIRQAVPASSQPQVGTPLSLGRPPLRPVSDRAKTPPLLVSHSPPASPSKFLASSPINHMPFPSTGETQEELTTSSPLLGPGVFRDSAFSSTSEVSCEIPIKWTGPLKGDFNVLQDQVKLERNARPKQRHTRTSSVPTFPGGWQPTPIQENPEGYSLSSASLRKKQDSDTTPIHENGFLIEAPQVVQQTQAFRKSEAALVDIIQSTSPIPPVPPRDRFQRKESSGSAGGHGWVLINVEGSNTTSPIPTQHGDASPADTSVDAPLTKIQSTTSQLRSPVPEQTPPAAKAIVIIDALDSKHKKSRSTSLPKEKDGSAPRRFFSLSRKHHSNKEIDEAASTKSSQSTRNTPRRNLRERLRLVGTTEALRNEDKRVSID